MFGRVRRGAVRAAAGEPIKAYGVLHAFNPEVVASALAAGMGAASIMSGSASATTDTGTVSAVAEAVNRTLAWGQRNQRGYVRLPHRVLVVLTAQRVIVQQWTAIGAGPVVASWPVGSFVAKPVRFTGEIGAEVILNSGLKALLTTRSGPTRRRSQDLVAALVACRAGGR